MPFAVLFTLWLAASAMAGEFTGPVVGVLDGDTVEVLHHQHPERVRLSGIDCPEKGQPDPISLFNIILHD
ncbi:MAG: hypothetical protein ABI980_10140 [Nitrospirota bacterium]